VIGAIDCTHVRITKPHENGDDYVNRKNYPSINVQATCNAEEKFTSVNASWPGSVHDSRIWRNCAEFEVMKSSSAILIGDSGYGITPWLLTPYKNPQTPAEVHFNKVYAHERVIIERCFGQVKRRFPILHYKVRVKLEMVGNVIIACFVLHNVAKYLNEDDGFPELDCDSEVEDGTEQVETDNTTQERLRRLGQQKRQEITNIIFRNLTNTN
jgi:hypothetical protein